MNSWLVIPARLGLLVLAMTIAAACGGASDDAGSAASTGPEGQGKSASEEPRMAPKLDLEDVDGNRLTLADSAGKVRLVDFWATWCPPCVKEMPVFKELHETYGERGLVIVGLSSDESAEIVRDFVRENEIPWANAVVTDEVLVAWKVAGLPQTYIVGPDGTIVKQFTTGAVPKSILVREIEKVLPPVSSSAAGV
jgi:thiol-disulfide isomerase/thioredoxin